MTGTAYYIKFTELAEVLGESGAAGLCKAMGGTRFYVREHLTEDCPISLAIGTELAQKFADHIATGIGGMFVEIPRARPESLRERVLEGTGTERSIAEEFGVHVRTVRRMRRRIREEAALPSVEALLALPSPGQ